MATAIDVPVLDQGPAVLSEPRGVSQWPRTVWKFCRRKPMGAFGGLIVVLMLFCALFVDTALICANGRICEVQPLLAPYGYNDQDIHDVNADPSVSHVMGTDQLGRDIFSRILYGARISAVIGLSAVLIAVTLAVFFGTISGYYSGWVDTTTQRFVDIILSIPPIILVIFAVSVFAGRSGPYTRMFWIIVIVGFLISAGAVRVIRGSTISTANNQYIDAARALGATSNRIVMKHIIPNVLPVAIVLATVSVGTAILVEASISFLGYGIPPPFPSWGGMLNITGSSQFRAYPLQALWPGLAIALTVFGFNMFGDALRDVLDPRLRGGR